MLKLNENQIKAMQHNKGAMMVLSGPGSGKTTVITYRIKNLIEKHAVLPNQILVITFTKAAAEEMKNRFSTISKAEGVGFGTFHSYFYRIIRNHYKYELNDIIHTDEKMKVIKKIIVNMNIAFDNEEDFLQSVINEIALVKNELIDVNFFNSNLCSSSEFIHIFENYEAYKNLNNKIDFDDMLIKCYYLLKENKDIREFWRNKYQYILIDEFQDINKVQYECIKLIVGEDENIFVVGDDDQSIYSFRGSSPEFLFEFPNNFANTKVEILNTNYRCSEQIISLSNTIIMDNENRYEKNIVGDGNSFKAPTLLRNYDQQEEAKKITEKILKFKEDYPLREIAIIYRTNLQARAMIEVFMDHNIEYQVKDKVPSIYEHFVAKDIFAYLNLALNKLDNNSFLKIANKPKRYLNKNLILDAVDACQNTNSAIEHLYCSNNLKAWQREKINDLLFHLGQIKNKTTYEAIKYICKSIGYAEYLEEYAHFKRINPKGLLEIMYEVLESGKSYDDIESYLEHIDNISIELDKSAKYPTNNTGVVLTTMHSAKGLEFDIVFIIGCVDGIIPHEKSKSKNEIEEERRLFYVALTRARKMLFVSILKTRYDNEAKPSRFLSKIIKK